MRDSRSGVDTIEVVNHDTRWHAKFLGERKRIGAALGSDALEIEHIGSTAVPDLAAKPVIDILVGVADMKRATQYKRPMRTLGYVHVSHEDDSRRLFFYKGRPRVYHVHIIEHGSEEFLKRILFRDHLLNDACTRERYADMKRSLARKYRNDREAYVRGKGESIESVLSEIRARVTP